jgi:hypothetical protein
VSLLRGEGFGSPRCHPGVRLQADLPILLQPLHALFLSPQRFKFPFSQSVGFLEPFELCPELLVGHKALGRQVLEAAPHPLRLGQFLEPHLHLQVGASLGASSLEFYHPLQVLAEPLRVPHQGRDRLPYPLFERLDAVILAVSSRGTRLFTVSCHPAALVVGVHSSLRDAGAVEHLLAAAAAVEHTAELEEAPTLVCGPHVFSHHLPRSVHGLALQPSLRYRDRYPLLLRVLPHGVAPPILPATRACL